eukprot:gnl/TRDRNA2_/TRDRNA2_190224_c0_seq1.p1 gnl/TRDRNA2_/TRDRNA2_190224_c0~~gnl/TRDRNA2_/TRDRNA2_190224_c0_seq1.p1  ORF type:complete len:186 (+),score=49.91 gnl/TRDRNA2_/TRDRNA2_190224_c0_seq1:81-638(+)
MGGGQSTQSENCPGMQQTRAVVLGMPKAGSKALVKRMVTDRFDESGGGVAMMPPAWERVVRRVEEVELFFLPLGSSQWAWTNYLSSAGTLAFVVDGSMDIDTGEVSKALSKALNDCSLSEDANIVVLVNKLDEASAEGEARLSAAAAACCAAGPLRKCRVFGVSAKTGRNLDEVLRTMAGSGLVF